MNLDDLSLLQNLDPHNLLAEINALPEQILSSWQLGQNLPLPSTDTHIERLLT